MIALSLLLAVQMSVSPPAPTVGDSVTLSPAHAEVTFGEVADGQCYELVAKSATSLVVRSFVPGRCRVEFELIEAQQTRRHGLEIEVASVLTEGEEESSPLRPPQQVPIDPRAWWSIGLAGAAAILAWGLVLLRPARAAEAAGLPLLSPWDELLEAVQRVGGSPGPAGQIAAADALRRFLSRSSPSLRRELTSRELVHLLRAAGDPRSEQVHSILRIGDRAKFAPVAPESQPELKALLQSFIDATRERQA